VTGLADRLYWPCWVAAAVLTGVVAGFMLGHALVLGRFVEWLVTSGSGELALAYPGFRAGAGRVSLTAFYAVCGLEVLSVVAFLAAALVTRRQAALAALAAAAGALWLVVHYASGFGALEAMVLGGAVEPPRIVAARFVRVNTPIHLFHAAMLVTALGALLAVPLAISRQKG
jgi:hypothetical protein